MTNWIPLWDSALDSTLWEESPEVLKLFFTLCLMKDMDNVVRAPLRRIAKRANLRPDKQEAYLMAEQAMGVLLAPDTRSTDNQEFEGRRIKRLGPEEWLVLNADKYQQQMMLLTARLRKAQKQRDRRAKARALPEQGGPGARERLAAKLEREGEPERAEGLAGMGTPGVEGGVSPGSVEGGLVPGPEFL